MRSIDLAEVQRTYLLNQISEAAVARSSRNQTKQTVGAEGKRPNDTTESTTTARRRSKMVVDVKNGCESWHDFLDWIRASDKLISESEPQETMCSNREPIFKSRGPYDVMIDGANVGYYKQNYHGAPAHIDYFQVDAMIRYLQSTGRRVLLVLHCRHLHPNTVPPECIHLITQWADERVLVTAPAGSNDGVFDI